jgi:branched-chain amino acid transport system permease protein
VNNHPKFGRNISFLVLLAVMVCLPIFWHDQYILHLLIIVFIYSLVALGVRLIMLTGQWTFGQAAFLAIGSYSSVLLVRKMGLSFWAAMPLAGLVAAALAILLGYPILRLKGIYFSMLTLCLGEVARTTALELKSITGGASGIIDIAPPPTISFGSWALVQFDPTAKLPFYYLALVLLCIALVIMERLNKSKMGRAFRAVNQCDSLAESLGINTARYKVIAFAIGSFFAGISGAFLPTYLGTLYPDHFNVWQSIYPVVHVIVGGMDYLLGPPVGTLFVVSLFELTRAKPEFQQLTYAFVLVFVILLLPTGIMSLSRLGPSWWRR